jgi:23S rRNA (uracil1939-C5)-methyltransferase
MALTVHIDKLVHRGAGLGRLPDGRAVFVPFTCPGEEVQIRLEREQRSWAVGILEDVRVASPERRVPPCPYYGQCGGCQLMHLNYPAQRDWKRRIAEEQWRNAHPVQQGGGHDQEFGYRHRVRFHVPADNRGLGFMSHNTNTIVDIEDCLLCAPAIRQVMPWLRQRLLPELTEQGVSLAGITIALGDKLPLVIRLQPCHPVGREIRRRYAENPDHPVEWNGDARSPRRITLRMGEMGLAIDAAVFFQAHPVAVAELLADPVLTLPPDRDLLELYCGVGLFSVHFAGSVRSVLAVEGDPGCTRLFHENVRRAGRTNIRHREAAVEQWLAKQGGEVGQWGALFLDPPRTGLSPRTREALARGSFSEVLYLSCDIATQHRDLQPWLQSGRYELQALRAYDFFPNTFHIECLARLHGGH